MWIPEWLGTPYCALYAKYKKEEFSFEDAKEELGIPESRLLKILSELGKHGFLISKIENKSKKYKLSDFDSIALGIKMGKELRSLGITEKLKKAFKEHGGKYLIVGSSAAFLYHTYQFPVKYKIEIFAEDYGFWRNLLPEAELIPKLNEKKFGKKKEIDGLFVSPPERVITEGLKEGGITSALDVVSLIISEVKNIDWKSLETYAIRYEVINELGAVLEALNKELMKKYGKSPILRKTIDKLFTHVKNIGRVKKYPKVALGEDKTYSEVGEKWRLKLRLSSYAIKKPVEDLAPFVLEAI